MPGLDRIILKTGVHNRIKAPQSCNRVDGAFLIETAC